MSFVDRRPGPRAGLCACAALLALTSCSRGPGPIAGKVLLDKQVELNSNVAGTQVGASEELHATPGSAVVVFVEEGGTDVSVELAGEGDVTAFENSQKGEGLEIAVAFVPASGRVGIRLFGPRDFERIGAVALRAEEFTAEHVQKSAWRERLDAYRAWARATTGMNRELVNSQGAGDIDKAIAVFESSDDEPESAVLAAKARAVRARMFYEYEAGWREARDEAARAAAAFAALTVKDPLNAARARRLQAAATQEMVNSSRETAESKREADQTARRIYAELLRADSGLDGVGRGRIHNDLGIMDVFANRLDTAMTHYEAALGEYRAAGYTAGIRQTARNLVGRAVRAGQYRTASRGYAAELAYLDALPNDDARAALLINAAAVDINIGETDLAISRLRQAEEIAVKARLVPARIRAIRALGIAYWGRGDVEQARTYLEQAIRLQEQVDDDAERFVTLRARGALLRENGEATQALADHRQAATLVASDPIGLLRARTEIARDYLALGDHERALRTLREARADKNVPVGHPTMRDTDLFQAETLLANARPPRAAVNEAEILARQSLQASMQAQDLYREIASRRVLGAVAVARGNRVAAIEELERAIELARKYSRSSANPELQSSTRQSLQRLYSEYIDLQMTGPTSPEAQVAALGVLESLRASTFSPTTPAADNSREVEVDSLLTHLADRHIRLAELQEQASPDVAAIESLQLDMATLRADIDRLRAGGAQGSIDSPATPFAFRALLQDQAQLSYAMGSKHAYLWSRTPAGVHAWVLPGTVADLRNAILRAAAVDRMQSPGAYDAAIQALSPRLLPAGILSAGARELLIAADGELGLVPFAALTSPADASKRIAQTHVITMVASLGQPAGSSVRTKGNRWKLVTVGGGDSGAGASTANRNSPLFPALRGAAREIDSVIARYSGDQRVLRLAGERANTTLIRAALQDGADVMHFASHGLANLKQPLASLLALPGGPLTAGQIQQWRGQVGLVFLSACETAVGPTRFADGMPGLQRAFLSAGSSEVIATLWPVEDELAAHFAEDFYEELMKGKPPAQALAATQGRWVTSSAAESPQSSVRRRTMAWSYVLYSQ